MHVTHLDDQASPLAAFSASPFRPEEWRNLGLATCGPSQKYWRGLSGPRHPWLRRKCSMQAPTATALFSLPDGADDSETPSPYFTDGPLARLAANLGNGIYSADS